MKKHYVYIVKCQDDSYYTGWTTDLKKRIHFHNIGKGAKYTRAKGPVELVYYEVYEDKSSALKREYAIKQLTHQQKANLIKAFSLK
ncbi:GIY-YIG nuclease family protein [Thomasclavelia sp.]|uniref:GIY-YIG nuclease family protein n=1 Tax=Thomasclavelia sp. TaxID=3025757 RepID=UPI0025D2C6A5|nr:GIY-YIG nuclease family protein [Thomasclavelia sp.]